MRWTTGSSSHPILNSPYDYPSRHWELDDSGQPTNRILDARRRVSFISPIPKPRKRRGAAAEQASLVFDEASRKLADGGQQYDLTVIINEVRRQVDAWRSLPEPRPVARDPGNRPPAATLAASPLQRHSALLLPESRRSRPPSGSPRWRRNAGPRRQEFPRPSGQRQPRRQSGPAAAGPQAGHRCRQDHRHGDADRLADRQRGAPAAEFPVHPQLPGRDPGHHHQRPPAGAAA